MIYRIALWVMVTVATLYFAYACYCVVELIKMIWNDHIKQRIRKPTLKNYKFLKTELWTG